jgi:Flp pilus assembly pilin Flp
MDFKTIREFHWITKVVIGLTGLFLALILIAMVAAVLRPNDYSLSNGLGMIFMSLGSVLTQVFLVILVIVAIYMVATRIKMWIEKYLDAMLAKLDTLSAQKADREHTGAELAVMNEKVERLEKKLDNIEYILEKVSE